jgi:hypothetical protein
MKQEDSLDHPLERFLLRNGSQTTERGLRGLESPSLGLQNVRIDIRARFTLCRMHGVLCVATY